MPMRASGAVRSTASNRRSQGSTDNSFVHSFPRRFTATRRVLVKAVVSLVVFQIVLVLWGYFILTNTHDITNGIRFSNDQGQHQKLEPHRKQHPDGHFNGHPVYFHDLTQDTSYHSRPYSIILCAGENYQGDEAAWMQRSCHFRFLCFNISSREFEVYARPVDEPLQPLMIIPKDDRHPLLTDMTSSVLHSPPQSATKYCVNSVSLGGIRPEWFVNHTEEERRQHSLKWFPRVVNSAPPERYYALDENVVFAPFHSLAGWDPTALLWDDLFPIYNLLYMFQLHDQQKTPLLLRMVLHDNEIQPSCDDSEKKQACSENFDLFRSLLTHPRETTTQLSTQLDAVLEPISGLLRSNLVCARDGVAGMGALTSAGTKNLVPIKQRGRRREKHRREDPISNNIGRGGLFWKFRNHCLQNMGLKEAIGRSTYHIPVKITFAVSTQQNLKDHYHALQKHVKGHDTIQVELLEIDNGIVWSDLVKTVTASTFLVTADSRGAVLATFLPKGASLVALYGSKNDDGKNIILQNKWDLLNHWSYMRVHWLPATSSTKAQGIDAFLEIMNLEIALRKGMQRDGDNGTNY